ncbi:MAG: GNAT family N-acetyltransferase [Muribaculaceae bacterium]|nr:GNAT family N-acetyltransferase [Muribaculaceae bacterium]
MIKLKSVSDVQQLMEWRAEVIRAVFDREPARELLEANSLYYAQHLADGSHLAVVAGCDGAECGCGAVCFTEELPSPDNPSGLCAYLMNIYVRPDFRGEGVATAVVKHLIKEALKRNCNKIYLETTAQAKPVYEALGFADMPDMMKYYGKKF